MAAGGGGKQEPLPRHKWRTKESLPNS
uniref:Uncharacterized protein n=1 Tax=Nelumbo nucifera TaxID=4432 RepID=A0A822XJV5_NELNU|nr:TPA_asm: hypothetical protein HUJ06_020884 [Nelumbo nucifera]